MTSASQGSPEQRLENDENSLRELLRKKKDIGWFVEHCSARLSIIDNKFAGILQVNSIFVAVIILSMGQYNPLNFVRCDQELTYLPIILFLFSMVTTAWAMWISKERFTVKFQKIPLSDAPDFQVNDFEEVIKTYAGFTQSRLKILNSACFFSYASGLSTLVLAILNIWPKFNTHFGVLLQLGLCN